MLAAPLMSSLALLWIAIEVTTVVSALLVAIEDTDGAAEASWKYVLIASAGLGLGLLATIFAYYAGAQVLGVHSNLAIQPLIAAGPRLPKTPVELAFLLAVLGYGTKVGLVPVHTWLPDAHSEAPTPVSALLSGALLATSFYAILRFYQVASAALGSALPRDTLLAFGIASLLLASLYLFGQRDIKRMLAYSSVEHMGILAIGVSFGAPIALAGVLLHVLAHAAAKGNAFMGAGVFTVKYGTKQMSQMRDGLRLLPSSGPMFLLAIFALCAIPPFGIFRSEFEIVSGGLSSGGNTGAAVLVILVTIAFFGLVASLSSVLLTARKRPPRMAPAEMETAAMAANGTGTVGGGNGVGRLMRLAASRRRGCRWRGTGTGRIGRAPDARRAERLDGGPGAGRAGGPGHARDPSAGRSHQPHRPGGGRTTWRGRQGAVTITHRTDRRGAQGSAERQDRARDAGSRACSRPAVTAVVPCPPRSRSPAGSRRLRRHCRRGRPATRRSPGDRRRVLVRAGNP